MSNPLRLTNIGKQTVRTPPPRLGEHSIDVLKGFGFSENECATLVGSGAVSRLEER